MQEYFGLGSIMNYISTISSIISIVLAFYAIYYAREESKKSEKNYQDTRKILEKIEEVALSNQESIGIVNNDLSEV